MALIVYNKENSRPQQVVYQGKRTITWTARERFTCQKQCLLNWGFSVEDGLISHTMRIREKDKRCARFSAGFIVRRIMLQAKVERKTVQFMIAKAPIEVGGTVYYKILLSNPILK